MKPVLLFIAIPLFAATTVQTVTEVSSQQAIIRYRTTLSPATACSLAITESVSGATPDNVNAAIFASSNLDTRPGSIISGPDRAFVFGQRTSAVGLDGLLHSRSAKANTAYTAGYTCGSDTGTVYFTTGNLPTGKTNTEQPPYNAAGFGNWAWPAINWSNQSNQYADPQTGVVIQRFTSPGLWGNESPMTNFDFAIGGTGWTTPQSILSGSACSSSSNCAQTGNANPIFVAAKGTNSGACVSGYAGASTCDDVLLAVTGKAAVAGAESVTVCVTYYDSGATCPGGTKTVTLSDAGYTTVGFPDANPGWSCVAPCSGGTPNWTPQFQFGEWGGTPPKQGDFGNAYGSTMYPYTGVTISGSSVSVACTNGNSSQSCFNPKWNNSYIHIQGSGCTGPNGETDICKFSGHPADTEHGTLTTSPGTCAAGCNWDSLASGFVITPNGAGTVDIGAQYSIASSAMYTMPNEGYPQPVNPVAVSVNYEADGVTPINPPVQGELAVFAQPNSFYEQLMLLIPSTGEVRMLSPLWTPQGVDVGDTGSCTGYTGTCDQNASQIKLGASPWDGVSATCFFGYATTQKGPVAMFKGCYDTTKNWKAYSHPLYACNGCAGGGAVNPGQDPGVFWYCTGSCNSQRWADDPIVYTDVTPPSQGLDPVSQATAHNPNYKPTIWPTFILDKVANGMAVFTGVTPQQGVPTTFISISTSTGLSGFYGDNFFTCPLCFSQFHSAQASRVAPGYYGVVMNWLYFGNSAFSLGGPFVATPTYVYFSGVPSATTTLTSTSPLEPCSNYTIAASIMANIVLYGGQNTCMHFRMPNVISHSPSAAEVALWPSGDQAGLPAQACTPTCSEPLVLPAGSELSLNHEDAYVASVAIVTDSLCPSGCLDIVAARGVAADTSGAPNNEPNGWSVLAGPSLAPCTGGPGCNPGVGAWTALNATGNMATHAYSDPHAFASHSDAGVGLAAGNMTFDLAGINTFALNPYTIRFNQPAPALFGSFAGAKQFGATAPFGGMVGGITLQSYPSTEQWSAPTTQEKKWLTDFHHTSPGSGSGSEEYIFIDPIAYSLVGGTATVYSVTAPVGGLPVNEANYKLLGLEGWAGKNLLEDVSGPGCSISDSTPYAIGLVLNAGECRAGSTVGQIFAAVPNVPAVKTNCVTDWVVENYPCVAFSLPNVTGSLVQHDASYNYAMFEGARVITMGFTGYGRQYEFNSFIPDSSGAWGLFKADWADGVRSEIFMAKLPPFPGGNSIPRNTFVKFPVEIPAGTAYAEIKFGYMENGSAASYYCTSRQDACTTSGSPFVFPSIDSRTPLACSGGCTVNVPAIAGRAVYYSIGSSSNGTSWTYGTPRVGLVQ